VSGITGMKYSNIDIDKDLLKYKDIVLANDFPNPIINEFDIVIPIIHNKNAIAYLLVGDIDEEKDGVSPTIKHMQFVQTLTNIVVVAIENKRLFKDNLKQEGIHREMELASEVQKMLVPKLEETESIKQVSAEGFYLPHFEIGGDYFDMFKLNNKEIAFCIADVSGKGISAALLMSNFQANLRAIFSSSTHLTDIVIMLNERVMKSVNGEKFITLFLAKYNTETKELRYINAGHNPPMLYNKKTKKLIYLTEGCIGLGMLESIETIEEGDKEIEDDSKLLCYTDGLTEIDELDGVGSSVEIVEKCLMNEKSIKKTFAEMIEKMNINKSNTEIFDDITMLGLDFNIT
jgi:sigma-B regulation protein RsbU (phosphoserine phosphatase)